MGWGPRLDCGWESARGYEWEPVWVEGSGNPLRAALMDGQWGYRSVNAMAQRWDVLWAPELAQGWVSRSGNMSGMETGLGSERELAHLSDSAMGHVRVC